MYLSNKCSLWFTFWADAGLYCIMYIRHIFGIVLLGHPVYAFCWISAPWATVVDISDIIMSSLVIGIIVVLHSIWSNIKSDAYPVRHAKYNYKRAFKPIHFEMLYLNAPPPPPRALIYQYVSNRYFHNVYTCTMILSFMWYIIIFDRPTQSGMVDTFLEHIFFKHPVGHIGRTTISC